MVIVFKALVCLVFALSICGLMLLANTPQYRVIKKDGKYSIERYDVTDVALSGQVVARKWTTLEYADNSTDAANILACYKKESNKLLNLFHIA